MSSTVSQAAEWVDALARAESRGHGDYGLAVKRVARRLRLSHGTLAGLLYRSPKDIWATTFLALEEAYNSLCDKQLRALEATIETGRRTGRIDAAHLAEAEALVARARGVKLDHRANEGSVRGAR